jgi:hypothetical protein
LTGNFARSGRDILSGSAKEGASSITQTLARNSLPLGECRIYKFKVWLSHGNLRFVGFRRHRSFKTKIFCQIQQGKFG